MFNVLFVVVKDILLRIVQNGMIETTNLHIVVVTVVQVVVVVVLVIEYDLQSQIRSDYMVVLTVSNVRSRLMKKL